MNRVIERYYDEDKLTARTMELDYGKGYYEMFLVKSFSVHTLRDQNGDIESYIIVIDEK